MTQQTLATAATPSNAPNRLLFQEMRQARLHVESIRRMNEQDDIEVGQLHGMHQMLKNAEKVLATTQAALTNSLF